MPCELYCLRALAYTWQYVSDLENTLFKFPLKQLGELFCFFPFFLCCRRVKWRGAISRSLTPVELFVALR